MSRLLKAKQGRTKACQAKAMCASRAGRQATTPLKRAMRLMTRQMDDDGEGDGDGMDGNGGTAEDIWAANKASKPRTWWAKTCSSSAEDASIKGWLAVTPSLRGEVSLTRGKSSDEAGGGNDGRGAAVVV